MTADHGMHLGREHRSRIWQPEPRCLDCGHRTGGGTGPPRQTRELPAVLWPFELAARAEARVRGWLARAGRL